ncbi:glutamate--tRNA ligase [uncultured Parasphingopyxis sp.]|uniref:glutamate--tRNA ligase n=1 Tax=uncultured Parasphingopyxis sp. TaxID=1547918 RepID=UPI00261E9219|nr:glutamate--tRNA ligase [uncultured Parasphingopyxis sp.]
MGATENVVTRFAPSPTGFLHIGGARTALFNWLFARHHGGEFKLRIEDTDKARSTDEAIAKILEGIRWLGLDWDGEEIYQSQRVGRHVEVAQALLEKGAAYRCYLTQEELQAMREKAQAERKPFRVESPWRDRDQSDALEGTASVVRLKAPRDGETTIEDAVQGSVTVSNAEIDDFVMLRGDGTPTYMLAVAVDDHDMGVTHCIRGDDHLNNAFRQRVLIDAMGWDRMTYAHVPLIHGSDGARLSKRHGALGVEAYRDEMGMLPEAVFNYLLRLGWGHGDAEIISREEATEWFDLAGVGKSPARFDVKKLENLNGHYLREADDGRLADIVAPMIAAHIGRDLHENDLDLLQRSMGAIKPRAKTIHDLVTGALFLFRTRPLDLDDKAKMLLDADARALLARLQPVLNGLADWTESALDTAVREFAESSDLKLGKVAQPLRAALTGSAQSPGIFDVLLLLGREESLARIADQAN